jgi:hypothetical protein
MELDILKRLLSESTIRVGLSPKETVRYTGAFGTHEKLPYSHMAYEYLQALITAC